MVNPAALLPVALGAIASIAGVVTLRRGYRSRKRAALTASAESKPIADLTAADGRVSLSGTVETADRSIDLVFGDGSGPVVKTEAARYDDAPSANTDGDGVGELQSNSEGYDYRQQAVQAEPFAIDDGTGTLQVDADETADAVIEPDTRVDTAEADPENVSALAEVLREQLLISPQTARIRQGVVEVGDEVTVQGVPERSGDDLVLGGGEIPILVSDRSRAETEQAQADGGVKQYVIGAVLLLVGLGVMALPFVVG